MRALPRWAPCALGGIFAGVAALLLFGYVVPWIDRSSAILWFFEAEWPILPPSGWLAAAIVGLLAAYLCRLVRR